MGCFEDRQEGYATPEPDEHDAMDAMGLDPNCPEDRELFRKHGGNEEAMGAESERRQARAALAATREACEKGGSK